MSTQDNSPKQEAAATATEARDLVPYTPPAARTLKDRADALLSSVWFKGGCVVAAICLGGIVGFVSIDRKQTQMASAQGQEMRVLVAELAELRQAMAAESQGRKQELATLRTGMDQMQRGVTASLVKASGDLDKANAARAAAEARIGERIERLEKQKADPSPTASIAAPTGFIGAPAAPASAKALPPAPPVANTAKESSVVPMTPPNAVSRPDIPVRGYVLRAVEDGIALVETRFGLREVQPGQMLPGAGRVQSIEKRGRKWVVVTTEGIIDSQMYR